MVVEEMALLLGFYRSREGEVIGTWYSDFCFERAGCESKMEEIPITVTARADSVRLQLDIQIKHLPPLCVAQPGVGARKKECSRPRGLDHRECGPMMHNPRVEKSMLS
jgi:hypothetical protein